jgi:hypothetical protein
MWLNVGCGTHRAPEPWWNVDTVLIDGEDVPRKDRVVPDQVIDPSGPLPFDDGSCDRVFLGHVLEHVPWEAVPRFLLDVRRVASAEVLIVGPDVYRCIESYRQGREPWSTLQSCLEHKDYPDDMAAWPGAPHHWNCHEARVIEALNRTGWHAVPVLDDALLGSWPVVGFTRRWQFAVLAVSDGRASWG